VGDDPVDQGGSDRGMGGQPMTAVSFGGRAASLLERLRTWWAGRHAGMNAGAEARWSSAYAGDRWGDDHGRELVFNKARRVKITGTTHEHNPGYDHDAMFAAIKAKLTEAQQLPVAAPFVLSPEEAAIPIDGGEDDRTQMVNLADLYDLEAVARARRIAPRID
jgi:hypothetical protein